MSAGVISYNDTNPAFSYQPLASWVDGHWNASNVGQTGTLHVTNSQNANVTFTFPVAAITFSYYGMLRSKGGRFAICVDCNSATSDSDFVPIDAFNATDDGKNPPALLYRQSFSTPATHHIIIKNMPDPRGMPVNNSQLTLQRIELEVPGSDTRSIVIPTSVTVSSTSHNIHMATTYSTPFSRGSSLLTVDSSTNAPPGSTPSVSPSSDNTESSPAPSSSSGTRVQSKTSIGIVLGALAALAFVLSIIVAIYWLRLQRKYAHAQPPPPEDGSEQHRNRQSGASRGLHIIGAPSDELPNSSLQAAPEIVPRTHLSAHPHRRHRRRERDLGRLPTIAQEGSIVGTEKGGTKKGDTLPPAYGTVFTPRRQPRQTRRNAARRDEYAEIR